MSGPYGDSKTALHFLIMLFAAEFESVGGGNDERDGVLFASVHPGIVDTDTARFVLERTGEGSMKRFEEGDIPVTPVAESAKGILSVAEGLTRERSGSLFSWTGDVLPF